MKGGFLLDVVVAQGASILELLSSEDKTLLVRGNSVCRFRQSAKSSFIYRFLAISLVPFLVLDFGLDVVDGVGRLHLKGDSLARKGLDEDLHLGFCERRRRGGRLNCVLTVNDTLGCWGTVGI